MTAKQSIFQKIGDEAVRAKTQRDWQEWFGLLDAFDVKKNGHTAAARFLNEQFGLDAWWAQAVSIRYEWERGLRI